MTGAELALHVAAGAPDPADARRRAERLTEAPARPVAAWTDDAIELATLVCRRAPYLATLLARDPERLHRVAADPHLRHEKPAAAIAAEVTRAAAAADDGAGLAAALRRVRGDELVRLGARELALGLDTEVGRELAHLADACFDAAITFHDARLRVRYGPPRYPHDGAVRDARLCVMAMGKHGGLELNFASDVDVIYLYSSDQGQAGPLSLHEYFAKLATAVTAALSEVTDDDVVFRVDLRLRPEGTRGAIANSLGQAERYYETFGRPWERQAWIKARPCAGDRGLGDDALARLAGFIHPRHTSPAIIAEVTALNRRIKAELGRGRGSGFDVKNGHGGIREVEFFVQALQLIHAGHDPHLRARGTLPALDALLFAGLVTDDEHQRLHRGYRWLRQVEHLLQLEGGLQTQQVPADPGARTVLARRLGLATLAEFDDTLAQHAGAIAALFTTLGDPDAADDATLVALARGELAADRAGRALAGLGFRDPVSAARELDRARRPPWSPWSPTATGASAHLAAPLLAEIAASADPDAALRHVGDLIGKRGAAWSGWRRLDDQRPLLRLLLSILGASEYLARSLIARPELIDLLADVGHRAGAVERSRLERDAEQRATAAHADAGDEELAWSALAEFKNAQVLRIGVADFAGQLAPLAVCRELTQVAEVCLERAVAWVAADVGARHGVARSPDGAPARLAVLGLGKLGGGELGYAADLDVVFVYDHDGESDGARPLPTVEVMTRIAQRLVTGLHAATPSGRLYELDTRLRPSGGSGLLVSSLAGWRRYHATEARSWERQALIKLRPVAGDGALGRAVAAEVASWLWSAPPGSPRQIALDIAAMRDRMERELGSATDLKVGKGGIIDAEFAAQYLQLVHGHAHPALRVPTTHGALRAAAELGLADPDDLARLDEGYRFWRLIEHRLRVVHDRPVHHLPTAPDELAGLARRCGFPDSGALQARVATAQRTVRAAFERVLGVAASAPARG